MRSSLVGHRDQSLQLIDSDPQQAAQEDHLAMLITQTLREREQCRVVIEQVDRLTELLRAEGWLLHAGEGKPANV